MKDNVLQFITDSKELVRIGEEYEAKGENIKALRMYRRAMENRDYPYAYICYARYMAAFGPECTISMLARALLEFPDNSEIYSDLLFLLTITQDEAMASFYSVYDRAIAKLPSSFEEIDAVVKKYPEVMSSLSEGFEDFLEEVSDLAEDNNSDFYSEDGMATVTEISEKTEAGTKKNSSFYIVDETYEWHEKNRKKIEALFSGELPDEKQVRFLKRYYAKRVEYNCFDGKDKEMIESVMLDLFNSQRKEEAEELADMLLLGDERSYSRTALHLKSRGISSLSAKSRRIAKKIIQRLDANFERMPDDCEIAEIEDALVLCSITGLDKDVCAFCEKHFSPDRVESEDIEFCYALSLVNLRRFDDAMKSLEKLVLVNMFSLSYRYDMEIVSILREEPIDSILHGYRFLCGRFTRKIPDSALAYKALKEGFGDDIRETVAPVLLYSYESAVAAGEEEYYRTIVDKLLAASDSWINKAEILNFALHHYEDTQLRIFIEGAYAQIIDLGKRPRFEENYCDILLTLGLSYPLPENAPKRLSEILDDIYSRMEELGMLNKRIALKTKKLISVTALEKLQLHGMVMKPILDSNGLNEGEFTRFKELIYG